MKTDLNHYKYPLAEDRIAKFPLKNRDESKLLFYKRGDIEHHIFKELPGLLPANTALVFNNTKVIQARLHFNRTSGARIEIFCLEPIGDPAQNGSKQSKWICLVGNRKKWKEQFLFKEYLHRGKQIELKAEIVSEAQGKYIINFEWNTDDNFYTILELMGETPLPPYLKREAVPDDSRNYQTVYAKYDGAVAAPTAGLHFSPEVLSEIENKKINTINTTLHVSAGTFQPIKEKNILDHPMHEERISFKKSELVKLLKHDGPVICVGTTSMRSLESLFWFGNMLQEFPNAEFNIPKLLPYEKEVRTAYKTAIRNVLKKMDDENLNEIWGTTSIFIFPSYKFRIATGLITNYHQPGSTLILLVAAFVGNDWEKIYNEALSEDYRFLSYGDSSLLLPIV